MKVKDLREYLEACPDDDYVVLPGSDHSYRRVSQVSDCIAESNNSYLCEYFDDTHMDKGSKKVRVVVIE